MRFVITGEWSKNGLLQLIIVIFVLYVAGLWLTNALLYFNKMSPHSPVGNRVLFSAPKSDSSSRAAIRGMLEILHFHLFAMGLLLLTLTHLMLFVPLPSALKVWLIVVPFLSAAVNEAAGWLVRFVHPVFAWLKIVGFLALEISLAGLVVISLWAVFRGSPANYRQPTPGESPSDDDTLGLGAAGDLTE